MIVRIKASRGVYRRCGVVHTPKAVDYPGTRFTEEELGRLQADPVLTVTLLDGELETSGELDGKPGTDDNPVPAGNEPGTEAQPIAPQAPKPQTQQPQQGAKSQKSQGGQKGQMGQKAQKAGTSAKPAAKPAEKPASEPALVAEGAGATGASGEEQSNADGGQQ